MKFLFVLGIVMMVVCYLAVISNIFPRTTDQKALGDDSDGNLFMGIGFYVGLFCAIVSASGGV